MRRTQIKILIILSLGILLSSCDSLKTTFSSTSIEDIVQAPEAYDGQIVSVKGRFHTGSSVGPAKNAFLIDGILEDKNGFRLDVRNNEDNQLYDLVSYSANGTIRILKACRCDKRIEDIFPNGETQKSTLVGSWVIESECVEDRKESTVRSWGGEGERVATTGCGPSETVVLLDADEIRRT